MFIVKRPLSHLPSLNKPDGSVDLLRWECVVPGKKGCVARETRGPFRHLQSAHRTKWENGNYPVTLEFSEDYPSKCPKASLPGGFFRAC